MKTTEDAPVGEFAGLHVLVVDDEADIRLGLTMLLQPLGLRVSAAESGRDALAVVEREGADVVLTDLQMPGMSGAELLAELKTRFPSVVVVILTGYGTIETAVQCMQQGASHFLTKPFDNAAIRSLVTRLGRQILAGRGRRALDGEQQIVAGHPRMRALINLVDRVGRSPVPVLIEGETGTGKELVARAIHARSAVADRPFLAVNAAALPDTLLEAELFGHEKGAFTGADRRREGIFAEARGGTVFLDEVSSMSLAFQGKLLRVLQDKVVRPLGGSADQPVEFRLVSATNRDLSEMIERGEFREDLYYRLRVVSVPIPALRERRSDLLPLAHHFLARATQACLGPDAPVPRLSPASTEALESHAWPGNVRELENAVQRAVVVCGGDWILPHHLGLEASAWAGDAAEDAADYESGKRRVVQRFQRAFVERALEQSKGNLTQAADECGLTRAAMQRIVRQLGIDRAAFERS